MLLFYDKFNNLSKGDKIIFLTRVKKCADCKSDVALGLTNCLSFESCANYLDLLKLTDEELNQTYLEYWIDHNQIPCLYESCAANNGSGYCEMPSYFMRIDENGECEFKDTCETDCHEEKVSNKRQVITCPKCGFIAEFSKYYNAYICTNSNCTWESEVEDNEIN